MPSSLPVLRARPSENTLKLAIVSFNAPEFSDSTESTLRSASRAACVMPCPAPGSATSVGTSPRLRDLRAAFERDHGHAGQALELQADLGVGAHRRRRSDRDGRIDAARVAGREAELGHLADPNAIEQHGRADKEARNGALELDAIARARAEPAGVLQPVDEAEYGDDGRQHEGADNDEGSAGFHLC